MTCWKYLRGELNRRGLTLMSAAARAGANEVHNLAVQMRRLKRAMKRPGDAKTMLLAAATGPTTWRTGSGRIGYGLHPKWGAQFWTASRDKAARRRVRSRIAHRARLGLGPAPAPYRIIDPIPAPHVEALIDHLDRAHGDLVLGATLATDTAKTEQP